MHTLVRMTSTYEAATMSLHTHTDVIQRPQHTQSRRLRCTLVQIKQSGRGAERGRVLKGPVWLLGDLTGLTGAAGQLTGAQARRFMGKSSLQDL